MAPQSSAPDPAVSILIPARNAAATVARALQSILATPHLPLEVIAVDDGSTDGTATAIESLRDERIRLIRQPALGITAALNRALHESQAPLIARMDADDVSLPGRLTAQVDYLNTHPEIGLLGTCVTYGGDQPGYRRYVEWTNGLVSTEAIQLQRFVESPFAHPSVMFRRSVVEQFGGYREGDFPEDYECWLRWMDQGVLPAKLETPYLQWNDPPERLSRSDARYRPEAFYTIKAHYLAAWLARNNPHHPAIWVCGAGRVTRKRLQPLLDEGIQVQGFVDVDPGKVGHQYHGASVHLPEAMPAPSECFVVSYVGARGARELIQQQMEAQGRVPGVHYILAA